MNNKEEFINILDTVTEAIEQGSIKDGDRFRNMVFVLDQAELYIDYKQEEGKFEDVHFELLVHDNLLPPNDHPDTLDEHEKLAPIEEEVREILKEKDGFNHNDLSFYIGTYLDPRRMYQATVAYTPKQDRQESN